MAEEPKAVEQEDMISDLSDGVLNNILSRLPTKSAVATGRLSRRWRHLWKHLLVLNFSELDCHFKFKSFALLVNGIFSLLYNPRAIRKFHLDCMYSSVCDDNFRAYSVDTWFHSIIGPHLQELNLNIVYFDDDGGPEFNLPPSLFTSTSLVSLKLSGEINLYIQSSTVISLPSLKVLLIAIAYQEVSSVNALLRGCPVIETLDLSFSPLSLDKVCIPSSLKRLKINASDTGAHLEINAPDLEYLNITQITFGEVFSMYNLHSVVEAHLDVFPESLGVFPESLGSVIPLHNLLGALSGTKHLVLSRSTTQWLLGEPRDLLFQEFQYLIRLELVIPGFNSNFLLSLLQKCPMLRVLIIQHQLVLPVLRRAQQPGALNCLIAHLSFIQFKGFQGYPDEVSFVAYVLLKGPVLKTVIITSMCLDLKKKYSILKTLSNVPRASGVCQLTFD